MNVIKDGEELYCLILILYIILSMHCCLLIIFGLLTLICRIVTRVTLISTTYEGGYVGGCVIGVRFGVGVISYD